MTTGTIEITLSPTQIDITRLWTEGMKIRQIAERLGLSPKKVDNELTRICLELGVDHRSDIPGEALRLGIVKGEL